MSVKSLGEQCMKAYKNPCDGFYAHKLGIYVFAMFQKRAKVILVLVKIFKIGIHIHHFVQDPYAKCVNLFEIIFFIAIKCFLRKNRCNLNFMLNNYQN